MCAFKKRTELGIAIERIKIKRCNGIDQIMELGEATVREFRKLEVSKNKYKQECG